ncbi:hypothetical protein KC19_5G044800 [Ceratodon purpureus]|uniref:Uncharacterized protein n=1 Tax=Ceratodon purpureus TaxID=3225 RepID=A0A8T0HZY3_CERPU|nr:hypothetical protein KC19_5G044800 [Ceratodon purpureus]
MEDSTSRLAKKDSAISIESMTAIIGHCPTELFQLLKARSTLTSSTLLTKPQAMSVLRSLHDTQLPLLKLNNTTRAPWIESRIPVFRQLKKLPRSDRTLA